MRRLKYPLIVFILFFVAWQAGYGLSAANAASLPDQGLFDQLLRHYVHTGKVDYKALKSQGLPVLSLYFATLARTKPADLSRADRLAFWINAYNAFVIKGVLEHYPIDSVRNIPGFFTAKQWSVGGQHYSLNQIENDILRKEFQEPRIHFLLVCAAQSCPPLQTQAVTAENLKATLEAAARGFVNDSRYVHYDAKRKRLFVSTIFKWYGKDFQPRYGGVLGFLRRYAAGDLKVILSKGTPTIEYLAYNWKLNQADSGIR